MADFERFIGGLTSISGEDNLTIVSKNADLDDGDYVHLVNTMPCMPYMAGTFCLVSGCVSRKRA